MGKQERVVMEELNSIQNALAELRRLDLNWRFCHLESVDLCTKDDLEKIQSDLASFPRSIKRDLHLVFYKMDSGDRVKYLAEIKESLRNLEDPHKQDFVLNETNPHPPNTREWDLYDARQFYQHWFIETICEIESLANSYLDKLAAELPENNKMAKSNPKGLHNLTLGERFYIANENNVFDALHQLNIAQDDKHKLLAIIMNCNKDNAKHLLNGSYRPLNNITQKRKRELQSFMENMD